MTRQRKLTYQVWHAMHSRCTNQRNENFSNYGGRGISVCERWASFDAFVEDMGMQPPGGMCIDRIDVNGNYEPGNCRWVTRAESTRNRRVTRFITHGGKTQCLADWANELGVSQQMLWARLQKGWTVAEALSYPVMRRPATQRPNELLEAA